MSEPAYETDAFLKLLTDALRAGPGSPAWHDAVAQLKGQGIQDADELRLLCEVREHLESGKDYRTLRAGPGFTRKLMAAVDGDAGHGVRSLSLASLVAILSGVLLVGVLVVVGVIVLKSGPDDQEIPADLRGGVFTREFLSSDFSSSTERWRELGTLPVRAQGGLRALPPRDLKPQPYTGGGLISVASIAPSQVFEASAIILVERATENLLVQLFVTDDPVFPQQPQAANPGHELVCYIQSSQVKVGLPDNTVKTGGQPIKDGSRVQLRIRMDRQFAVVESDGKELYAGRHGLSAESPRHVGIRFEARAYEKPEVLTVQSVRIVKP